MTVEQDILNLYNRVISYSLQTKVQAGEYACREIVKSIRDARTYNSESFNDALKNKAFMDWVTMVLSERDIPVTEENIVKGTRKCGFPKNFKPSLAKSIYSNFCEDGYTCLDYSAGFGGRLMGCLCTGKNLNYIGFEPNTKDSEELVTLGTKIKEVVKDDSSFRIINDMSENIQNYLQPNSIDFAFSCPPYFRYEEYCYEETQSSIKYPIYEDWLGVYVKETCKGIYNVLKTGSLFLVYLMNITIDGVKYSLIDDWINIAIEEGFILQDKQYVNMGHNNLVGEQGKSCLVVLKK